ncbi:hypothetical protein IWX90DRAFT_184693 [Phyllosticta citrichinensis]|uniref:Rhodopsin domain-containing protein n=1 Tax=Phyllosticta citrichinensis TaxID=1130410 RepID=A0ABR1XW21_9PEZI
MVSGREATVACFVSSGIATGFVGLRLYTRFRISRHPGWDDTVIVIADIFSIALCPIYLYQLNHGMGQPIASLTPEALVTLQEWFWASTWVYVLGVAFAKVSILIQFLRIFVDFKTRFASWFTILFIVTCCTVCFFGGIFACNPVHKFWNQSVSGTCINYMAIWYMHAGMSILSDILIIITPLPIIFNMNLEKKKKISLAVTFAIGGFGLITSVIRLYCLHKLFLVTDKTLYNPLPALWSTVELNTVIICGCLITLHPLLSILIGPIRRHASSSSPSNSQGNTIVGQLGSDGANSSRPRLWGTSARAAGSKFRRDEDQGSLKPLYPNLADGVKITTTIDMRSTRRGSLAGSRHLYSTGELEPSRQLSSASQKSTEMREVV